MMLLCFLVVCFIVALDQIVKHLVIANMAIGESIHLLGPLNITYVQNTGAAFSIFRDGVLGLAIMTTVIIIALIVLMFVPAMKKYRLPLAIIIGGGIGNLIDRFALHYVVDFINLTWWPVFNISDIAVVVGVILLCIKILFIKEDK